MGKKDNETAEKIMANCFSLILIFAVGLTILFSIFAPKLLILFGASDATLPYAVEYARIYIFGSIFVLIVLGMNLFITTQGFSKISMMTTLIGAVINVILDPIFIFVFDMGVRVFVPASQSGQPRGADLSQMIGQTVSLRITEVNRARRRVVGSIRAVQYEERQAAQAAIWESIEVGKHYTGTVKSMTSYGVFVDIGGVDGMVHISELSWSRIKNPAEVVSVGDTLDVYVISFDPEKHKISLGVKDRSCNPWDKFMETYKVGDVASVRIVKLMTFGAFAEVVPGVDGLIHISQIADRRIEKPGDVLSEGQIVDAKITAVDEEKQKISLSIRALLNDGDEDAE